MNAEMTQAIARIDELRSKIHESNDPNEIDAAMEEIRSISASMQAQFEQMGQDKGTPEFVLDLIRSQFDQINADLQSIKENHAMPPKSATTVEPTAANPTTQGTSTEPTASEPDGTIEIAKAIQSLTATVSGIVDDIKNAKATKEAKKAAEAAKPVTAKVKDKAKSYAGFGLKALEIGAGAGIVIFAAMVGVRVGRKAGNAVADKLVGSSPAPTSTIMMGGQPVEVVETPVLTKA